MAKTNVIQEKSFLFAIEIVKTVRGIRKEEKEFEITRQLLRSGTSIGANIEEAIGAQSNKDFIHKMSVSYKEARETKYWLRLIKEVEIMSDKKADELLMACEELLKILGSILKKIKSNNS